MRNVNLRAVAVAAFVLGILLPLPGQAPPPNQSASNLLPQALQPSIRADFPSYRIPEEKDLTNAWATSPQGSAAPPFFCRGDFNGDGFEDVAIVLIGESGWRFVIFEQTKEGQYRPAFVARQKSKQELGRYAEDEFLLTPQQLLLQTVKKGQTWSPEAGDDPDLGPMKLDTIEVIAKPIPNAYFSSVIIFKDGKYQQVYREPLMEVPLNTR